MQRTRCHLDRRPPTTQYLFGAQDMPQLTNERRGDENTEVDARADAQAASATLFPCL